ncbi:MAG: Crp/Fnr family transcriptional regulator [Bacteroidota bacterium]
MSIIKYSSAYDAIPCFGTLTPEDLRMAGDYLKVRTLNAGEVILRAGGVCEHLYFIVSGLVFSHTSDEKIVWYESEGNSFTDVNSFYTREPSENFIRVAEDDTTLLSISHEHLQHLYQHSHRWAIWGTQFHQQELTRLLRYYEALRVKDASERYFDLIAAFPDVLQRVPLGHIASYLGISQVSLSRIRAGTQKK